MFVTDFDGTLTGDNSPFNERDIASLEELRQSGCTVVLASGRSPFSLRRTLGEQKLPVDWFVLSSGAGVMDSEGRVKVSHILSEKETAEIHGAFTELGISDISIQGPFPDAHLIHWIPADHGGDFTRRLEFYRGFYSGIDSPEISSSEVIGFVEPDKAEMVTCFLKQKFKDRFSIVRATSPLDGVTVWIEVFSRGVNKGSGCEFIRQKMGIKQNMTAAVGNDWNDIHMLDWAEKAYVTANAPKELLERYTCVPCNNSGGVAEAASRWLEVIS